MRQQRAICHVGTYSDRGGAGLYPLRASPAGGFALGKPFTGAPNASFGVYSRRYGLHYFVDERSEGMVRVLRREPAGWRQLGCASTHGAEPCYLSLSPDGSWLAVANYRSGNIALFRIHPDTGLIAEPAAIRANHGHGPVADRQDGPHAHCAVFAPNGGWLFQTDLGADQVLAFALDRNGLRGEGDVAFAAPPGSGPRHLVFHPNQPTAILVCELASTLTVFDLGEGTLTPRQTLSTLPPGYSGESLGGHLALNAAGDRLYVTNRGRDSIAVLALEQEGLSHISHTPAGGASPRHFALCEDQRRLFLANEESGSVTIFDIADGGRLSRRGEVAVPGAAYVFMAR